jgi:TP901 family phage tail tape measure protein
MNKALEIAVVLSAVDRMSQVFNNAVGAASAKLKSFQEQYKSSFDIGKGLVAGGMSLALSLAPAISAYSDLEDSSTRLKTVMMQDGAVLSRNFDAVNKIATDLGDRLPGTTADFQSMFATLIKGGISEKSILDGVGKASAYLAVGLKVPYEEAAKLSAKLKEATGVADGEMLQFMDTIARVNNLGVETGEMQFAFSRSAGALKLLNIQGLEASKSIASVYAQLIKTGASGETVGTGMTSIFNAMFDTKKMNKFNAEANKLGLSFEFVDKKTGQFKGVENMISQFDRLQQFNPAQRAKLVQALLGPGQDAQFMNTLISQGVSGFNEMQKKMANQATLDKKVEMQLKTLANIWEATTGTFTNMLAAFGASFADELKFVADILGKIAGWFKEFAAEHPKLFKFIGLFIAVASGLMILVGVVMIAKAAFMVFNAVLLANPIILIVAAIVAAGIAIYVFWDEIVAFFISIWQGIKKVFIAAWGWLKYLPIIFIPALIIHNWGRIMAFLSPLIERIKAIFMPLVVLWKFMSILFSIVWDKIKEDFMNKIKFIFTIGKIFFNAGKNIITMLWNGIKAMAAKPIEAIKNIVQKMRDYLPYSPAKEGAFKDLHKVRIVETIAQSIKPMPMVRAIAGVTQAARGAINGKAPSMSSSSSGGGGGGVVINYSPSITIGGAVTPETQLSFAAELRKHSAELMRMIEEVNARKARLSF